MFCTCLLRRAAEHAGLAEVGDYSVAYLSLFIGVGTLVPPIGFSSARPILPLLYLAKASARPLCVWIFLFGGNVRFLRVGANPSR